MTLLVPDVGERTLKTCALCGRSLPRSEFHKKSQASDGLSHRCKACRKANPGSFDPAKRRKSRDKWKANNPDKYLSAWLKCTYGINLETFKSMLAAQGGTCAICKKPETHIQNGKVRRLCVDHSHVTGKVRALLCLRCNIEVGIFEHPTKAALIRDYLAAHGGANA